MLQSNLIATLISQAFVILSNFLISVLTCHYLGVNDRGKYFFVITLSAIIAQFSNLGLHSSNTYFIAKDRSILQPLVANTLWISLIIGCGFAFVSIIAPTFLGTPLASLWKMQWYILILTPTTLFYLFALNLLIGLNKIKTYNYSQILSYTFITLIIFMVSLKHADIHRFLLVTAMGWLTISCVMLFVLLYYCPIKSIKFDWAVFKTTINYSIKAYVICLLSFLALKGNILLIGHYCGYTQLGYFSIASQINDALTILPSTIALLLFPNLVSNDNNRWLLTKINIKSTGFIMLMCCVFCAVLAKPVITLFFGKNFTPAIPMVLTLLPGTFFLGITTIISQYIASLGMPYTIIKIWVITFIISLISSYILIPQFKGIGAAAALSFTYFILLAMITWLALILNKPKFQREILFQS